MRITIHSLRRNLDPVSGTPTAQQLRSRLDALRDIGYIASSVCDVCDQLQLASEFERDVQSVVHGVAGAAGDGRFKAAATRSRPAGTLAFRVR